MEIFYSYVNFYQRVANETQNLKSGASVCESFESSSSFFSSHLLPEMTHTPFNLRSQLGRNLKEPSPSFPREASLCTWKSCGYSTSRQGASIESKDIKSGLSALPAPTWAKRRKLCFFLPFPAGMTSQNQQLLGDSSIPFFHRFSRCLGMLKIRCVAQPRDLMEDHARNDPKLSKLKYLLSYAIIISMAMSGT